MMLMYDTEVRGVLTFDETEALFCEGKAAQLAREGQVQLSMSCTPSLPRMVPTHTHPPFPHLLPSLSLSAIPLSTMLSTRPST
jgi:hypothetical protein